MSEDTHHLSSVKPPWMVVSLSLVSRALRKLVFTIFAIFRIAFIEKPVWEYRDSSRERKLHPSYAAYLKSDFAKNESKNKKLLQ